jgi:hypothetical protein
VSDERRCARCGEPVPVGQRTCPNCGRLLVDRQADRLGAGSAGLHPVAKSDDSSKQIEPERAPPDDKTDSYYSLAPAVPPPGSYRPCRCAYLLVPLLWIALLVFAL